MTDRIILKGLEFWGYHGVRPEENTLGQPFVVDLELYLDLSRAGHSDHLEDTVNYSQVYRLVQGVVTGRTRRLLETVAEDIAGNLLDQFPVERVRIRVEKPHVPIPGPIKYAAVEIEREKG